MLGILCILLVITLHAFYLYDRQIILFFSLYCTNRSFFIFPQTKHPDMPKKPLTPYFRFFMEKREKYHAAQPNLSMTDLSKVVAAKFHELSDKKKVGILIR